MISHLLTQKCLVYNKPTSLDKFGNPSDWDFAGEIKCRFVPSKRFKRDAQNRELEIEAMLTTLVPLKLSQKIIYLGQDYTVISTQAMTSPNGNIGYTNDLIRYKNKI